MLSHKLVLARYRNRDSLQSGRSNCGLLHNVSELVREQLTSFACARCITSGIHHDIVADGVRQRMHSAGRFCCTRIYMHTHRAEVMPEARIEECARFLVKRLSR